MAAKIKSKSDYYARERRAGYLFVLAPVLQFFYSHLYH